MRRPGLNFYSTLLQCKVLTAIYRSVPFPYHHAMVLFCFVALSWTFPVTHHLWLSSVSCGLDPPSGNHETLFAIMQKTRIRKKPMRHGGNSVAPCLIIITLWIIACGGSFTIFSHRHRVILHDRAELVLHITSGEFRVEARIAFPKAVSYL